MPKGKSPQSTDAGQAAVVAIFRPYPCRVGQRIFIESGPRHGDWEVMAVSDDKIRLRCPISWREVEWAPFCYLAWEGVGEPWPHQ